ncbi:MAG: hypothetical protein ACO2OX_03080 [Candidatus Nanopusillus sp.]
MVSFRKEIIGEISILINNIIGNNNIIFYDRLTKYENDDYIYKEKLCHLYTSDISLYLSLDYDVDILKHLYEKIKNEGIKGINEDCAEHKNIVYNYENSVYNIEISRSNISITCSNNNILSIDYGCNVYKVLKIFKSILKERKKILDIVNKNYEKILLYLPYIKRNFLYKGYDVKCGEIDQFSVELFLKERDVIVDNELFQLSFEYIFGKYKNFDTQVCLYFENGKNYISLFDFDLNILDDILEIMKKLEDFESSIIELNKNKYEIYFIPNSFLDELHIWNNGKILSKLLFEKNKKDLIGTLKVIIENKEKFFDIYKKSTDTVFNLLEKSIKKFLEDGK